MSGAAPDTISHVRCMCSPHETLLRYHLKPQSSASWPAGACCPPKISTRQVQLVLRETATVSIGSHMVWVASVLPERTPFVCADGQPAHPSSKYSLASRQTEILSGTSGKASGLS